jgi:hypothetical protein
LKKRFFKTFSAENAIFSQHFGGKIFCGIFPKIFPEIFAEKKCTKNRPQMSLRKTLANYGTTLSINTCVTFAIEKADTSLLFKKMPKVNYRPRRGNLPNLVTPNIYELFCS